MEFEMITTSRLRLRKMTQEVFDYIYSNYSPEELKVFLGLESDEALEKERSRYERGLSIYNKSFLYFQLIDQPTGRIIGWCGFHTWYLDHSRAEIGYAIFDEAYKHRGYMSEAMTAVLNYGFERIYLNRIEAFIGPSNIPSLRLVEQFGFSPEGRLREHFFKNGVIEDSLVYSLLAQEYKPSVAGSY